jgi:hypothetical protein
VSKVGTARDRGRSAPPPEHPGRTVGQRLRLLRELAGPCETARWAFLKAEIELVHSQLDHPRGQEIAAVSLRFCSVPLVFEGGVDASPTRDHAGSQPLSALLIHEFGL